MHERFGQKSDSCQRRVAARRRFAWSAARDSDVPLSPARSQPAGRFSWWHHPLGSRISRARWNCSRGSFIPSVWTRLSNTFMPEKICPNVLWSSLSTTATLTTMKSRCRSSISSPFRPMFYATVDCVENRRLPWPSRLRFAFRKTKLTAWTDSLAKSWSLSDLRCIAKRHIWRLATLAANSAVRPRKSSSGAIEQELQTCLPVESGSLMMTYEQLRGSDASRTHRRFAHHDASEYGPTESRSEAYRELAESKQRLESQLGMPIKHFSYPCPALSPHWSERTVEQSRALGYETAVTTDSGLTRRGDSCSV